MTGNDWRKTDGAGKVMIGGDLIAPVSLSRGVGEVDSVILSKFLMGDLGVF